jgi:phosphatidylserine/phosphatidylglycerophosphate/cardiolipin synthase-like enzyme
MMKLFLSFLLLLFTLNGFSQKHDALFSPYQGKQAFQRVYSMIDQAKTKIYGSIYSWSDTRVDRYLFRALKRGVTVNLVLHRPTAEKPEMRNRLLKLSQAGAMIKKSFQWNHEKFFIIDNVRMYNGSANLSGGAQSRYNESIIFLEAPLESNSLERSLINQFRKEFFIQFNSADDLFPQMKRSEFLTDGQDLFSEKEYARGEHWPVRETNGDQMILFSSSMNFRFTPLTQPSIPGRYFKMKRIGTWTVRDQIIKLIRGARSTVYMNMNHVFTQTIMDELLKKARQGVKVFLAVDNQEFRDRGWGAVFTPYFVDRWRRYFGPQSPVPVRVKYYSHHPFPNYWYLNHNKYFMADIDLGPQYAKVLTGSYNISYTAEHKQFDNQVLLKGANLKNIILSFKKDFDKIWYWGRTEQDQVNMEFLNFFLKPNKEGYFRVHLRNGMSMTWAETEAFRNQMRKIAPGILKKPNRDYGVCTHYDPKSTRFIFQSAGKYQVCNPKDILP